MRRLSLSHLGLYGWYCISILEVVAVKESTDTEPSLQEQDTLNPISAETDLNSNFSTQMLPLGGTGNFSEQDYGNTTSYPLNTTSATVDEDSSKSNDTDSYPLNTTLVTSGEDSSSLNDTASHPLNTTLVPSGEDSSNLNDTASYQKNTILVAPDDDSPDSDDTTSYPLNTTSASTGDESSELNNTTSNPPETTLAASGEDYSSLNDTNSYSRNTTSAVTEEESSNLNDTTSYPLNTTSVTTEEGSSNLNDTTLQPLETTLAMADEDFSNLKDSTFDMLNTTLTTLAIQDGEEDNSDLMSDDSFPPDDANRTTDGAFLDIGSNTSQPLDEASAGADDLYSYLLNNTSQSLDEASNATEDEYSDYGNDSLPLGEVSDASNTTDDDYSGFENVTLYPVDASDDGPLHKFDQDNFHWAWNLTTKPHNVSNITDDDYTDPEYDTFGRDLALVIGILIFLLLCIIVAYAAYKEISYARKPPPARQRSTQPYGDDVLNEFAPGPGAGMPGMYQFDPEPINNARRGQGMPQQGAGQGSRPASAEHTRQARSVGMSDAPKRNRVPSLEPDIVIENQDPPVIICGNEDVQFILGAGR
nr:extracellular matrix protein papilin 3 [Haemonchus contortus]